MRKHYSSYGCTASITGKSDGTAVLMIKDSLGRIVRNSTHKNFKAAEDAWRRMCNSSRNGLRAVHRNRPTGADEAGQ